MSNLVKDIMGAITDDFARMMRNWAAAKAGSSLGYASVNLAAEPSGGYREARCPILFGESDDTDVALQALPVRYRHAVEMFWAWEQTEITVLARRHGVDKKTYASRVMEGHILLRAEKARRRDAVRRQETQNRAVQNSVMGIDVGRIPV